MAIVRAPSSLITACCWTRQANHSYDIDLLRSTNDRVRHSNFLLLLIYHFHFHFHFLFLFWFWLQHWITRNTFRLSSRILFISWYCTLLLYWCVFALVFFSWFFFIRNLIYWIPTLALMFLRSVFLCRSSCLRSAYSRFVGLNRALAFFVFCSSYLLCVVLFLLARSSDKLMFCEYFSLIAFFMIISFLKLLLFLLLALWFSAPIYCTIRMKVCRLNIIWV